MRKRLTVLALLPALLTIPVRASLCADDPRMAQSFNALAKRGYVQGIRACEVIRADLVAVSVDQALGHLGAGRNEQTAAGYQQAGYFTIASENDEPYAGGVHPSKVGRESLEMLRFYSAFPMPGGRESQEQQAAFGPLWGKTFYWHTYYLRLPQALRSGKTYTITVDPIGETFRRQVVLAYDEEKTPTRALKVNQVAYSSRAKSRYAYLGWWAGDLGTVDYSALKHFRVVDEAKGRAVLQGAVTLRRKADSFSGEDTYQLDLSALAAGRYHIVVPGLGRSVSFAIGGKALQALHYHTMRAFYYQRCGQAHEAPYALFTKKACHLQVYESGYLVSNPRYQPKPNEAIRTFRGGYHDAADYDVFARHLPALNQILVAYEFAPECFKDGELNIPESGNGIPDMLDEVHWGLFFFRDHQREDGAIPSGRGNGQDEIQARYDRKKTARPPFGLLPPVQTSVSRYVVAAANYARLVERFDAKRAHSYLESAERAYVWVKEHEASEQERAKGDDNLFRAWAAAELFRTTGEAAFQEDFIKLYHAGALKGVHWSHAAWLPRVFWPYVTCKQAGIDKMIQQALRQRLIERANSVLAATVSDTRGYRMGRRLGGEDRLGWGNGNGGGKYADPCLRAYRLTGEQKFLDAATLNMDFQLGANPLRMSFVTGMGETHPHQPTVSDFQTTKPGRSGASVKGLTVYGLATGLRSWYPDGKTRPPWRRFTAVGTGAAASSEFTIDETLGPSAMMYAILWALESR